MKKKSISLMQNKSVTYSRFNRKLASQSFIKSDSGEIDVQSKLRRSTRRATIERRVWCPPQKEKLCRQRKYSSRGRLRESKSAYVKWKESQKRKIGCRQNFLSKSRVSLQGSLKSSILNDGKVTKIANGSYLLQNLKTDGIIGENELTSLQSVITEEIITDSYTDMIQSEIEESNVSIGKGLLQSKINLPCSSHSSKVITIENNTEASNKQKLLDSKFESLSLKPSTNMSDQIISSVGQVEEGFSKAEKLNGTLVNDDTHVSLDEALAELVNLEHGNECETVTIHPAFNDEQKTNGETSLKHDIEEESKPLNLIVKKSNEVNHTTKENGVKLNNKISDNKSHLDLKIEPRNELHLEKRSNSREKTPSEERWNRIANLIRVPSKPPSVKTPLKCSDCAMRFCTVRSLLWHFGTHLKMLSKQESPNILEDLVAAWDTPEKPLKVGASKSYNYKMDYKWPFQTGNGQVWKSSSYSDDDYPEDLSLSRNCEDIVTGVNGEVILKIPAIPKPQLTNIQPKPSSLRSILTNGNAENNWNSEYLKCNNPTLKPFEVLTHKNVDYSSVVENQIPNFFPTTSVYAVTQLTPTISTSSATLDTYPTDANIRLLSHVSNTLNKIDTSANSTQVINHDDELNINENSGGEPLDENFVRINDTLALRIVSTATTVGELTISVTNSTNNSKKSNQFTNTVTIFPQTKLSSELSQVVQSPDILTIVPQTEAIGAECGDRSPPHIITATGKLTPDSSQIVKLVLKPQEAIPTRPDCDSSDDSSEESDCGMVIDVKDEDNAMYPLSLCSVSLDEEIAQGRTNLTSSERIRSTERKEKKIKNCRFNHRVDDENYKKRKYVCQYCQKRFGWSTDLKRHIILHTGERPFKCKWCPITFTRKFLLQNHMRKMHPQLCRWSDLWE